jgi:hypothetical protein
MVVAASVERVRGQGGEVNGGAEGWVKLVI